jgi:hypothetical protein
MVSTLTEQRTIIRRQEDRTLLQHCSDLEDMVCPVHFQDKAETEKHREMVCKKIAGKADVGQVKNILYIVSTLITICCLVVAGQAIWLKSDIHDVKVEAVKAVEKTDSKIDAGIQTIHGRISENNDIRVKNDEEQTYKLNEIRNTMNVIDYRLTQIEADNKKSKK